MSQVLPKSAIIVLDTLADKGPLHPKGISKEAEIPLRTVSYALRRLVKRKLCRKIANLSDMRCPLYLADQEKMRAVYMKYGLKPI